MDPFSNSYYKGLWDRVLVRVVFGTSQMPVLKKHCTPKLYPIMILYNNYLKKVYGKAAIPVQANLLQRYKVQMLNTFHL